jgi:prepilin-type N-terminal cleavage/methylation domain-containing protein
VILVVNNNNLGMTLIELLVALAIMSAGLIPIMQMFPLSMRLNINAQDTYNATIMGRSIMNRLMLPSTDDEDFEYDTNFAGLDNIGDINDLQETNNSRIQWYAEVDTISDDLKLITVYVVYPSKNNSTGNQVRLISYRYNF